MKLFHFHKFKVVQAGHYDKTTNGYFLGGVFVPFDTLSHRQVTKVLLRCDCGELKTQELEGIWDIDALTAPVTDKEFLKKAGIKA